MSAIFKSDEEYDLVAQWVTDQAKVIGERTEDEDLISAYRALSEKMASARDELWAYEVEFSDAEIAILEEVVNWRLGVSGDCQYDDPEYKDEYRIMRRVSKRIS